MEAINAPVIEAKPLDIKVEISLCYASPEYFISNYCYIFDSVSKDWILFDLWPEQHRALNTMHDNQLAILLKARQVGLSWLALAYGLWQMLFRPIAVFLIFSRRETEAKYLLGEERLKGIYRRLPDWMRNDQALDSKTQWGLENGSMAHAFPTGVGDSYTATFALIDEADLVDDLGMMLPSINPTIQAGGKLVLVSRVNKRRPNSAFKTIYKAAQLGKNSYAPIFIAWDAHPGRDQAWYNRQLADLGSMDDMTEQYPATDTEALSRSTAGRIYPEFAWENVNENAVYDPAHPILAVCDDGYTNPRCILLIQERPLDGEPDRIVVFREYYQRYQIASQSLDEIWGDPKNPADKGWGFPLAEFLYYDPSAASFAAEAQKRGMATWGAFNSVDEGVKVVRKFILDGNGQRRLQIHPSCEHLIEEMFDYSEKETQGSGDDPKPIKAFDHSCDALRYFLATRYLYEI